jgi:hypothetical protein
MVLKQRYCSVLCTTLILPARHFRSSVSWFAFPSRPKVFSFPVYGCRIWFLCAVSFCSESQRWSVPLSGFRPQHALVLWFSSANRLWTTRGHKRRPVSRQRATVFRFPLAVFVAGFIPLGKWAESLRYPHCDFSSYIWWGFLQVKTSIILESSD